MQYNTTTHTFIKTILIYVIWIIFSASQMFLALNIHDVIISIALIYSKNPWMPRAIDMWSMVVLGIVVLATIFVTESYLSKGMKIGRFWQRVAKVALIEGVLALILYVLSFIY